MLWVKQRGTIINHSFNIYQILLEHLLCTAVGDKKMFTTGSLA